MEIRAPTRGNRRLEALLAAANADPRLHAWWYMQQVNAERRDMSDHSWVHVQIVVNISCASSGCSTGRASSPR